MTRNSGTLSISYFYIFIILLVGVILYPGVHAVSLPALPSSPPETAASTRPPVRTDDPLWTKALSLWEQRGEDIQNVKNALGVFRQLAVKHPDQTEPELWLCRVYYFLGIWETDEEKRDPILETSIDHCNRVLAVDPENPSAGYWLGSAWSHFKEIDTILPRIRKLSREFPPGREIPIPGGPEWKTAIAHWDARADLERARLAVNTLEDISGKHPDRFEVWAWLARAYYWLGENAETEKEQEDLYTQGYENGQKAVDLSPLSPGANYWTAANMGRFAQRGSIFRRVKFSRKMFEHIRKVDLEEPHYYFGAIPRYLAFCLAHAGALTRKVIAGYGYRPDNTFQTIQMSIALEPNYFGTRIALAELAISLGKKDMARDHLTYVLNTPPDSQPLCAPENRLDQKKARHLLEALDK